MAKEKKIKNKDIKRIPVFRQPTALCLGGGGARGFAHVGALKAFEEADIDFDFVVGTSAGALVGALYCFGFGADRILEFAETITERDFHNGIIFFPNNPMRIAAVMERFVANAQIQDLPKRFVAVAADLVEGKQHFFESGSVATAVAASCAVPVFFKPVILNDKHLVDGGLLNNIPADVARMLGAHAVVTVDINPTRGEGTKSVKTFDVLKTAFNLALSNTSVSGLINSDVIIAPDLSRFKATEKRGYEEMWRLGYESAREKIGEILALCRV